MRRLLAAALLALVQTTAPSPQARSVLVIVVDGLRPDYVTTDVMPRLARLGDRGVVFRAHHSVFPTVTRVNGSSIVTGAYPETHGLLGNQIYVPAVSATRVLDTAVREDLLAVERAGQPLLTAPTLGEILERAGRRLLVVSSGTSGSAYLLNHAAANGVIVHPEFVRPDTLAARVRERLGPVPAHALPNAGEHKRAVDAYLTLGLDEFRPDVAIVWLSDPDSTAHAKGIGSAAARESLAVVDREIGRVEDALRERGLLERTDILVASDHGFSTHTGAMKLDAAVRPFARPLPDGTADIVVAEGAVYFRGAPDSARVRAVVAALQQRPEIGAIFARPVRPGAAEGIVPGTLSFDLARWNHARSGDILVSANWSDAKNEHGWAGTTTQSGVAGHGASSPFDVHNTLMVSGPDFRVHATSDAPTSNVDLAPTVLHLLGITPPPTMTGRVIGEAFAQANAPPAVTHSTRTASTGDGSYVVTAHMSAADGHEYLDYTDVRRR